MSKLLDIRRLNVLEARRRAASFSSQQRQCRRHSHEASLAKQDDGGLPDSAFSVGLRYLDAQANSAVSTGNQHKSLSVRKHHLTCWHSLLACTIIRNSLGKRKHLFVFFIPRSITTIFTTTTFLLLLDFLGGEKNSGRRRGHSPIVILLVLFVWECLS